MSVEIFYLFLYFQFRTGTRTRMRVGKRRIKCVLFELENMFLNQDNKSIFWMTLSGVVGRGMRMRCGKRERLKVLCAMAITQSPSSKQHPTAFSCGFVITHTKCAVNTHTRTHSHRKERQKEKERESACAFEHSLSNIDSYWWKLP